LIPQEFRIHSPRGHVLGALLLLNTVGVRLLGVVVSARVLLLLVVSIQMKGYRDYEGETRSSKED
jgi:hypothetical protein